VNNNDENKISKVEYFELREKRLKLVYKILYVVVAIWIAILLSISQNVLESTAIPVYAFMLSASSMIILQIVKYAMMEFRCMKIIGRINDKLIEQTEARYENIWISSSLILSFCGIEIIPHLFFAQNLDIGVFMIVFSVAILYFGVISIVKMFKIDFEDKSIKILDLIDIIVGCIATYSLCSVICLLTSMANLT